MTGELFIYVDVSIHASSREDATRVIRDENGVPVVSIHASSREDATFRSKCWRPCRLFQSTRPRGRTRQELRVKS